jgi:23S rRNA pseudouridine2605 synthase
MKSRNSGRGRRPASGGTEVRRDKKDSSTGRGYKKREESEDSPARSYGKKTFGRKTFNRNDDDSRKSSFRDTPKERGEKPSFERKPYEKKSFDRKPYSRSERGEGEKPSYERKSFGKKPYSRPGSDDRKKSYGDSDKSGERKKWNRKEDHEFYGERKKYSRSLSQKLGGKRSTSSQQAPKEDDGLIRLNKYIANAGICSRREADNLIELGEVSVNGEVITTLGYKVKPGDIIKYNNQTLKSEGNVYLLLNKPKDFITTVDDPQDRKTVMWLIKDKCKERVYPVGRLDRNTTGVLLFTNDGELAAKLTHPSFEVEKIYQVTLDKNLKPEDMEKIEKGINLEDGFIKPDVISYTGPDKSVIGIEIHSGRNRIVRRIFEQLGYDVIKLDRVVFAGLTKKDLPRGRSRFLTQLEVANLKMTAGKKKKAVSQVSSH